MNIKNQAIINKIESLDISRIPMWVAEAKFAFDYVKDKIKKLPKQSNILEIGCGSGILLSMLVEQFPSQKFDGIEPFGKWFFFIERTQFTGSKK